MPAAGDEAAVAEAAPPSTDDTPVRSYFTLPTTAAAPAAAAATAAADVTPATPVVASSAPAAPLALPSVTSATSANTTAPAAQPFVLALDELARVAEAAGLHWIQSDADKVAQVQAAIAAEPLPVRVPRQPKPVPVMDEGPLVLVETRRDLRHLKLPFES